MLPFSVTSHGEPMPDRTAAERQARRRARQAEAGMVALTIMAPKGVHASLRAVARRIAAGEPLEHALLSEAGRLRSGVLLPLAVRLPLAVPSDLQPSPGTVAVAVRLTKHASGHAKRRIRAAGLVQSAEAGAWVGVVTVETLTALRELVERASGSMVERACG